MVDHLTRGQIRTLTCHRWMYMEMRPEKSTLISFENAVAGMIIYEVLTAKIWDTQTGHQEQLFRNPSSAQAKAAIFFRDGNVIIFCSDDSGIGQVVLDHADAAWTTFEPSSGDDGFDGKTAQFAQQGHDECGKPL